MTFPLPTENDVAADAESETKIPYRAEESGLKWIKGSSDSSSTVVPLCNFTASITGDVIEDDGTESRRHYEITAKLAGETEICIGTTPATDFASLKWVDEILGARATILPGKAEHTRAAIRLLSTDIRKQRIIAHTGWREFDGRWLYFHHGGAIGADGLTEAAVRLPAPLAPFDLPDVPQGEARATAFKAVIELLSAAPDEITVPLIGAAFVAVLGKGDFSLHLCGQSGIGKSELAALVQSFFGAGFNGRNLPASWVSTGNSLEGLAHAAKDALLTVDDFCPQGTATDISRLHATAERVLRAQGNHSGRGRMNADGSLKPARPPRGLILSTGEDIPRNQSLRARLLILEIEKESDPAKVMERLRRLTPYQETARAGVYAQAMAAFIQWLATDGRIGAHQKNADAEVNRWRLQWHERGLESHGRTPTTLAHLARAWHLWIQAADEAGAVTAAEAEAVWRRVWQALTIAGKAQAHHLTAENPVTRFIELVQSVLTSGRAHLASLAGNMPHPDIAVSCGWQNGEAKGERIGWIDGDDIYLEPGAAFSCVQRAAASGEALTVAEKTLWKRLKEAGKLSSLDSERRPLVKKMICGNRPRVLHFKVDIFPAVSCHEKTGAIGAIGATGD